jgi:3-oxoacyl-[acyl-carrier protein] reductase
MKKIKKFLIMVLTGRLPKTIKAQVCYLSPESRLKGKRIIVTGGNRGIGYAMAKKFKSEGAQVLIAGRNIQQLEIVSKELDCLFLPLDVTRTSTFNQFILDAQKLLGDIDCLVNNAGVSLHEQSFLDVTPEGFDLQMNTNFKAPFFLTQSFIRFIIEKKKGGNVLIISSETGITSDIRPYGYTKAALNSMTEGLAYFFAKDGIRINAIAPGITATGMTGYKDSENLYSKHNMMERVYLPEEIAEAACFLLSDVSASVSGQILVCNNGNTVNSRIRNNL